MARITILLLTILLASGCAQRGRIVIDPGAASIGTVETVLVGTTRAPDPQSGEPYSRLRSLTTRYVRLDISVPPERRPGEIRWTPDGARPDPRHEFVTTGEIRYPDAASFRRELAARLAARPPGQREAVIFVHGFNTTFAEGAYRMAQLAHDLGSPGVLVHYAWPSRGYPLAYAYDRDSALFARDGLEELIAQVAQAGAERLLIVAHSMGSLLTMDTLRQLALQDRRVLLDRIGGVVLISPDLDIDLFRAQARRIGDLPQPFVIFTSQRDRALALSARLTGKSMRLGNLTDVDALADLKVTILDITAFSSGLGHFALGESPALIGILSRIGDINAALARERSGRTGLLPGVVLTVQNATAVILTPIAAQSPP